MHDPRIGRFFAIDPLTKKYPFYSPYSFSGNIVINSVELEGLENRISIIQPWNVLPTLRLITNKVSEKINKLNSVAANMCKMYDENVTLQKEIIGGHAQIYFAVYFLNYGEYTDADDVSVFRYGRTIDGHKAGVLDYSLAGLGLFVPFASGGKIKAVFKDFVRIADNKIADYFFIKRGIKNFDEFYKKVRHLSPEERIAEYKQAGARVADANGWIKDNKLSKINGRDVYKSKDGKQLFGLDTEKGTFEIHNSKGEHMSEINFEGIKVSDGDKSGRHDLKVK